MVMPGPGKPNKLEVCPWTVRIGLHDELTAVYDNFADLSIATRAQHSKCADDIDDDVTKQP